MVKKVEKRGIKLQNNLRIVMVTSGYFPVIGGAERQAQLLSQGFVKRGESVDVLTRRYPGFPPSETLNQVRIHRLPTFGDGHNILAALLFTIGVIYWLIRHRKEYDLVHVHQPFSPMTSALIAKFITNKPVVVKIAGSGAFGNLRTLQSMPLLKFRRWLMKRADRFLILNQETIPELETFGIVADQTSLIFNGVDTEQFFPKKQSANLHTELSEQMISVGRLSPEKGVEVLIKAWKQVLDRCSESSTWHLQILGDGPEKERLIALVQSLQLTEYVEFVGNVDDVRFYLQNASIFVLSSHSEGLPNALLEAMACGLAPITTAVGAIPEILTQGESGLLSEAGDVVGLAKNIEQAITNVPLRAEMGRNAHQYVEKHYSLNSAVEHHCRIYRECTHTN